MKLEEYKKDSYEFSRSASDLVRQFTFAGIAIIWIFKYEKPIDHLIPIQLFRPLLFLIITLCLDFFQYLIPAIIWTLFYRYHEKKRTNPNSDIKAPSGFSTPGWICFLGKIITLIISYAYITNYIVQKI